MEILVALAIFGAVGGTIASLVALGVAQIRRAEAAWAVVASRTGMAHLPGTGGRQRLAGRFRGIDTSVDTLVQGAGKSRTRYTRYRVSFGHPLGIGVRMTREGLASGLGQLLGMHDVRTGDPSFDRLVRVVSANRESALAFLTPDRRQALLRMTQAAPQVVIDDDGIEVLVRGLASDPGKIELQLAQMVAVASVLQAATAGLTPEASPVPGPASAAPPARGTSSPVPGHTSAAPPARGTSSPVPRTASSVPPARGTSSPVPGTASAAPPAPGTSSPVPGPASTASAPSAPGTSAPVPGPASAASPGSGPAPGNPPSPPAPPSSATPARAAPDRIAVSTGALASEAVCAMLFGRGTNALDAGTTFISEFGRRSVRWAATLAAVETAHYDVHLGSGPFARASFALCDVPGGFLTSGRVEAHVRFAPELTAQLTALTGQTVAFGGRLVACDPFARYLFLDEGQLLGPATRPGPTTAP